MLLLLLFVGGAVYGWLKWKPPKKRAAQRSEYHPPQIAPVLLASAKEDERRRKQDVKRAQARRDIETQTERIRLLDALLDSAKAKYHAATKEKDVERLARQIVSLEGQIAAAENKIEKAKYIVKYGG